MFRGSKVQGFKGSGVQRFPVKLPDGTPITGFPLRSNRQGSRFHSCPRTAFRMRIYEKSVSFVRPNLKFEAKLAITWENEHL